MYKRQRKNLVRALSAFERVHAEGLTEGWVVVGRPGWLYDDFFARMERSPARKAVRLLGYVPDEDLPALYAGAQALLFPSLYEGFGLPVLEAMACGTPVAASNASSVPEVGGDGVLYFDPTDPEEMAGVVARLLRENALREEMARRGQRQAARFSWARAAAETAAVYAAVLSDPDRR